MKYKPQTIRGVKPNLGLELRYRRVLLKMVDRMSESVTYWLKSAYRQNEPVMAEDAKAKPDAKKKIKSEQSKASQAKARKRIARDGLPAEELQKAVRKLARRWQRQINEGAPALAKYFAQAAEDRTSGDLERILSESGLTVEFTLTPAQRDVLKATVNANVALIRSLPAKYFASVEQAVMESVQQGRDLSYLAKRLQREHGITKRRAALIARDQNNKATSALQRARQTELGIKKAIWHHSHAGKVPRRTHVQMDGKTYDVQKGMYDSKEGRYVHPGELINCRCTGESVIPGLS